MADSSSFADPFATTLLDTVRALVVVLDTTGRIVQFNRMCEEVTGWTFAEVRGQTLWDLFLLPEERPGVQAVFDQLRFEALPRCYENHWLTRSGDRRLIAWSNSVLSDEGGRVQFLVGTGLDITETRRTEEALAAQARAILEVSTPVVQVWDGIVVVPLIGSLDSERTNRLMGTLLQKVVDTRSPLALVDITGVSVVDTRTAQHLLETASAVRLLGAELVLTGLSPAVAQTLVQLGIDLSHVVTRASLSGGLRYALSRQNLEIRPISPR